MLPLLEDELEARLGDSASIAFESSHRAETRRSTNGWMDGERARMQHDLNSLDDLWTRVSSMPEF